MRVAVSNVRILRSSLNRLEDWEGGMNRKGRYRTLER